MFPFAISTGGQTNLSSQTGPDTQTQYSGSARRPRLKLSIIVYRVSPPALTFGSYATGHCPSDTSQSSWPGCAAHECALTIRFTLLTSRQSWPNTIRIYLGSLSVRWLLVANAGDGRTELNPGQSLSLLSMATKWVSIGIRIASFCPQERPSCNETRRMDATIFAILKHDEARRLRLVSSRGSSPSFSLARPTNELLVFRLVAVVFVFIFG